MMKVLTVEELDKIFYSREAIRITQPGQLDRVQPYEMVIVKQSFLMGTTPSQKENYFLASPKAAKHYLEFPVQTGRTGTKWFYYVAIAPKP